MIVLSFLTGGCASGWSGIGSGGFEPPPSPYMIEHCKLDVTLDPAAHRLAATATLTVATKGGHAGDDGGGLYIELHRDLDIDGITSAGLPVPFRRMPDAEPPKDEHHSGSGSGKNLPPAIYHLDWRPPGDLAGRLVILYAGRLYQDVEAGEKPGEIHNFQMRAHVGEEGIYLGESGAWYPRLAGPDEDEPTEESPLIGYEVTVADVPGMVLVACGNRDGAKLDVPRGERTTWRSPFPFNGMALVGGPHKVSQRQVGDVLVSVHLSEDHADFASAILDALESYLTLYQPLLGDYPYTEFTYVENFFSSGFAFPGFTVLASQVVAMGPLGMKPGYLDHEMLHNWWGNGVFVSALDGNWCECLTSYCANYMRHVLEGRHQKARNSRRSTCYGLSRVTTEKDKPLGDFGRDDDVSRFIGYQKGSMVFAMLAGKVGEDTLWRALRRLSSERLGKPTGWEHIRSAVEQESGQDLRAFFDLWVRGSGVPDILIEEARYDRRAGHLEITVSQTGDKIFDVSIPVRLVYDDQAVEERIVVDQARQVRTVKTLEAPDFVELDPDFRVLHRVPLGDVMPTISGIGKSKDLLIVQAEEDGDAYAETVSALKRRYKKAKDTGVREILDTELKAEDLEKGHALLLGKACLASAAQSILDGSPLSFGEGHFILDKTSYDEPIDEVLCCLRNEHDPGGVICFYYGNSAADLKKAAVVTFYGGNSLVVFKDGRAVERRDFERTQRVAVQVGG